VVSCHENRIVTVSKYVWRNADAMWTAEYNNAKSSEEKWYEDRRYEGNYMREYDNAKMVAQLYGEVVI